MKVHCQVLTGKEFFGYTYLCKKGKINLYWYVYQRSFLYAEEMESSVIIVKHLTLVVKHIHTVVIDTWGLWTLKRLSSTMGSERLSSVLKNLYWHNLFIEFYITWTPFRMKHKNFKNEFLLNHNCSVINFVRNHKIYQLI